MRRCLIALMAVLFLWPSMTASAANQEDAALEVASAYHQDGALYAFVRPGSQEVLNSAKVSLMAGNAMSEGQDIKDKAADSPLYYMLLVDLSTSMPGYRAWVQAVAEGLDQDGEGDVHFTVAGFGERFEVIEEDAAGAGEAVEVLSNLPFDHQGTDICGGLSEALGYTAQKGREAGSLYSIIMLTDGIPARFDGSSLGEDELRDAAGALETQILQSPETAIHTIGFDSWEPITFTAVSAGSGLDLNAGDYAGAYRAGGEIAQFTESLYRLAFPMAWSQGEDRLSAQLAVDNAEVIEMIPLDHVRTLDDLPKPQATAVPSPTPTSPPDEPESAFNEAVSSESGEAESSGAEEAKQIAAPSPEPSHQIQLLGMSFPIWLVAALIALLLAVVILLAALASRLRKKRGKKEAFAGIPLRVKIIYGPRRQDGKELLLKDNLIIGSAPSCGLVLPDASVAPHHARIFIQDGGIWIEDLNLQSQTAIGGMKIHSPNRLRSGDEITVGSVCLQLLF